MDYEDIKNLINEVEKSNIEELNIEFPEGMKINMKKAATRTNKNIKVIEKIEKQEVTDNKQEELKTIKSPMVGTFYSSSSPNCKAFVNVGDKVKKGQVVCIIEAMKLMNEIESEFDGEIAQICVENEQMVEYAMPLFKVR